MERADIKRAIQQEGNLLPAFLQGGSVLLNKRNKPLVYNGGFCSVFHYIVEGKQYAIRCWVPERCDENILSKLVHRAEIVSETLRSTDLPYFVKYDCYEKGLRISDTVTIPIVVREWLELPSLGEYVYSHLNDTECIQALANNFLTMIKTLHSYQISHGDLSTGNILVDEEENIRLIDYDSMYVPDLGQSEEELIKGSQGFQLDEARKNNKYLSPKSDYFSELIIYLSLQALAVHPEYWKRYVTRGGETTSPEILLFTKPDLDKGSRAEVIKTLLGDSDKNISTLTEKLVRSLEERSIDGLRPLEQVIEGIKFPQGTIRRESASSTQSTKPGNTQQDHKPDTTQGTKSGSPQQNSRQGKTQGAKSGSPQQDSRQDKTQGAKSGSPQQGSRHGTTHGIKSGSPQQNSRQGKTQGAKSGSPQQGSRHGTTHGIKSGSPQQNSRQGKTQGAKSGSPQQGSRHGTTHGIKSGSPQQNSRQGKTQGAKSGSPQQGSRHGTTHGIKSGSPQQNSRQGKTQGAKSGSPQQGSRHGTTHGIKSGSLQQGAKSGTAPGTTLPRNLRDFIMQIMEL